MRGQPDIFNSDQGSQFTCNDFINVLKRKDIRISMDGRGRALGQHHDRKITELQATEEVRVLGQELIRRHALPANAKSGKKLVSFEHRKAVLSEVIAKQERPISDLHT